MSPEPAVTLAVPTYRRPVLLDGLLRELLGRHDDRLDVLVVDNDPDGGARDVVRGHPGVRYALEPTPGIAAARNRAIDEAIAPLLAFIDDDELPAPGWLAALLATQRSTGAAAVAGPVRTEFDGAVHPWIAHGAFLGRGHRAGLADGADIDDAATNNLLLDLSRVRGLGLRFDPGFGLTGGEDTLFTRRLRAAGGRIVWSPDAVVVDRVQAERMTARWMLRKALRYGNTDARVALVLARPARTWPLRVKILGGGVARIGFGLLTWARETPERRARGLVATARGCGQVLGALGHTVYEYRRD